MAEEYVGSKELTVTVLQEQPLCVTEIKAGQDKDFYNYEAKYEKNGSIHDIPAKISKQSYVMGTKGTSNYWLQGYFEE